MYDCKSGRSQWKTYHHGCKNSPQKYVHCHKLPLQKRMWWLGENAHSQCCCFLLCGGPSMRKLLACVLPIIQCILWLVHLGKVWASFSACHLGVYLPGSLEKAWILICPWSGKAGSPAPPKAEWVYLPNSGSIVDSFISYMVQNVSDQEKYINVNI